MPLCSVVVVCMYVRSSLSIVPLSLLFVVVLLLISRRIPPFWYNSMYPYPPYPYVCRWLYLLSRGKTAHPCHYHIQANWRSISHCTCADQPHSRNGPSVLFAQAETMAAWVHGCMAAWACRHGIGKPKRVIFGR